MRMDRRTMLGGAVGGGLLLGGRPATAIDSAAPNPLFEVFAHRQSVRKYTNKPIPEDHIRMIVDAARRAPTCMNQQPWKFLVVRDKTKIAEMKKQTLAGITTFFKQKLENKSAVNEKDLAPYNEAVARTDGYFTAPVYVVVLVDKECPCGMDYGQQDGVLAAGYLLLAARALGYGTVYLTDGVPEKVTRGVLNIPARYERICMTPIGVPDGWPEPKPKKKLEDLIAYETI